MKAAGSISPALGTRAALLPHPLARKSSKFARCATAASRKHDGHEQPSQQVSVQQNKSQDVGPGNQRSSGLQRSATATAAPFSDFGQVAPNFGRVGGFLRSIEEEMNNMLQAMTTGNLDQAPPELRDVLVPLHVDIQDKDNKIVIKADTPGLTGADLAVVLDPDTKIITISGERKVDRPVDDQGDYIRMERKVGRFERRFKLPDAIDPDNISAKVTHGVLEVHVPKTAPAQDKQQRINVT